MMSKIQTLATVYQSVLTALHNLEIKQIHVMHKLVHYDESLQKLNADFLGETKLSGKKSNSMPLVSYCITVYLSMAIN